MTEAADRLALIARWLQRVDDLLEYRPDGHAAEGASPSAAPDCATALTDAPMARELAAALAAATSMVQVFGTTAAAMRQTLQALGAALRAGDQRGETVSLPSPLTAHWLGQYNVHLLATAKGYDSAFPGEALHHGWAATGYAASAYQGAVDWGTYLRDLTQELADLRVWRRPAPSPP